MITGEQLIGYSRSGEGETFSVSAPATGETLEGYFHEATAGEIDRACALSARAAEAYDAVGAEARAGFLNAIADKIEGLGDALLERVHAESGLPMARVTGERGRTANQLRLMATEITSTNWNERRHDPALPDREPPRPDIRLRKKGLGPVVVFGASNFPLAFSVAGGDTASALAAGCPVIAKGHPAHPGTSELIAGAILAAAQETGMPEGVFSLLQGRTNELGGALVSDPRITAVGFTGSRGGGLALSRLAAARPVPIPVYAEMSAINPVILGPTALAARAAELAQQFAGSLTMGAGQFCTNPGLLLALKGDGLDAFVDAAKASLEAAPAQVMLTDEICNAYLNGIKRLEQEGTVRTLVAPQTSQGATAQPALFVTSGAQFLRKADLAMEVFGASSLIVECQDQSELEAVLNDLEGQLTASLMIDDGDFELARTLVPILERLAGRLIVNNWPTGVEVCSAMVHGGPYPATSDSRTTSVGTLAIDRFLRPICYQNFPSELLPAETAASVSAGIDG